ncbi:hypothetical protein BG004_002008 [Podila humilis]|nr:hypothetical protein BG004_002008 [Podila humilis]
MDRLEGLHQDHVESSNPTSAASSAPSSAASSSTSLDQIPPAMAAEGTTPAPSDHHSNMVSRSTEIILHDEESFRDIYHEPPPPFEEVSRPNSPSPPHTIATPLMLNPYPQRQALGERAHLAPTTGSLSTGATSMVTSSSPRSTRATTIDHRIGHESSQVHQQLLNSPFSFFSNTVTTVLPVVNTSSSTLLSSSSSSSTTKTLKIELDRSEIVLMTGRTSVLKGKLFLNLQKMTKVKTLHLEFSGRSSVTWVDDNAYSPATRHTTAPHIEHTWPLIQHQHKQPPTQLSAGQHVYPFSLELPDTLPESLTTTHGKVAYRLTATLVKPGLTFMSSTATAHVLILRKHLIPATSSSSRHYQRGARVVDTPGDKIKYKITLPQCRVPHGAKVPLQVVITSPSNKTTMVNVLQVGLWERVVYRADSRRRVDMRLVKIQKSEGWASPTRHQTTTLRRQRQHQQQHEQQQQQQQRVSQDEEEEEGEGEMQEGGAEPESVTWNKVLLFDMPQMGAEMNQVNPTADNGLMKITHLLRFTILGTEGTKRFKVENEMGLKVLAFDDDDDNDDFEEDSDGDGDGDDDEEDDEEGEGLGLGRGRRGRRRRAHDPLNELPSYLTSFTTPRVSFDEDSELGPTEEDILRATLARAYLPTYDESEEDTNSRNPSRNPSRNNSRNPSRSASRDVVSRRSVVGPHGVVSNLRERVV